MPTVDSFLDRPTADEFLGKEPTSRVFSDEEAARLDKAIAEQGLSDMGAEDFAAQSEAGGKALETPIVSPELARAAIDIGTAGMGQSPFVEGLRKGAAEQISGLTTPEAIATAPVFAVPVLGEGLALGMGAKAVGSGLGRVVGGIESGNPEEAGAGTAETLGGVSMIAAPVAHRLQIPAELRNPSLTPAEIAEAQRRAVNIAAPGTMRPQEVEAIGPPSPEKPSMFELGNMPFEGARRFGTTEFGPPQILPKMGPIKAIDFLEETRPKEELETRGKVSFGAEAPTLLRTAIENAKETGLNKSAEALAEMERTQNASGEPGTAGVPEHEVRAPVGEETSLRQQGETPGTRENAPEENAAVPKETDLVKKLEELRDKFDASGDMGNTMSLPHPDAFKTIGKSIVYTALDIAIQAVKAGRSVADAIDIALNHIKKNTQDFDESKLRDNFRYVVSQETKSAAFEDQVKNTNQAWDYGKANQNPDTIGTLAKQQAELVQKISELKTSDIPRAEKLSKLADLQFRKQLFDEALSAARNETGRPAMDDYFARKAQANESPAMKSIREFTGDRPATEEMMTLAKQIKPEEVPVLEKLAEDAANEAQKFIDEIDKKENPTDVDLKKMSELANRQSILSEAVRATRGEEPATLAHTGMGGAERSEIPSKPTIGETIPARPGGKPPVIPPPKPESTAGFIDRIRNFFKDTGPKTKAFFGGIAGQTLPRITLGNRLAGEAGARYLSSRIAAPEIAKIFSRDVLAGLDVDPHKFGAALSEDNLRSVREANPDAGGTFSFVGEGKPFKTEAEYQAFLKDPQVQEAIKRHVSNWNAVIEPMFREAMSIDPDVELPTRGKQTAARVNLAAIREGEPLPPGSVTSSPQGGLLNTLQRKSPFGRQAKGTGEAYAANYDDLIANSMYRQMEIANKNTFDKALVDSGLAVIDKPGQKLKIGDQETVAFPLKRRTIATSKGAIPANESIYIRKDLAPEYRNASNVDNNPYQNFIVNKLNGAFNQAALAGLTDATVHVTNLTTALAQLPVSQAGLLADSLLSASGRLDIPVALAKVAQKGAPSVGRGILQRSKVLRKVTPDMLQRAVEDAFWKNQTQLASLAEIGATKGTHGGGVPGLRQMSDVIQWYDRTTRAVLDDAYQDLAARGIVENTETARREFINQVGQYNKRAQGAIVRLSRNLGTGPFVTAGRAFNVLGTRAAMLSPGVKATSLGNAIALRANAASKWLGTLAFVGLVNYLITGKMIGRPGTPIGSIDSGTNDKNGRMKSFSIMNLTGQGRALRVTGVRGALEAKQKGLPNKVAADAAVRDIANSWIAPFAGPAVKAFFTGVSGYPPAINVGRSSQVVPPGQSQTLENLKQAAVEANPVVAGIVKSTEPGKTWEEAVRTQLPRFTMQTKQPEKMIANYPAIVRRAQSNAYMEDVIHRARYIEDATERRQYVREALTKLDPADRPHAELTLKFRKIDF